MHVHGNASEQKYENFTLHLKSETSFISLIRYQKVHKVFRTPQSVVLTIEEDTTKFTLVRKTRTKVWYQKPLLPLLGIRKEKNVYIKPLNQNLLLLTQF